MDVAPAAAEEAVVTEQWCKGHAHSSTQQPWRGCGSKQRALVEPQAAVEGHDCNGWQAASVRVAAGSGCGVHATACSGAACVQQHAAAASGWEQPAARLQLKTVMAAGRGGGAKSSG